MRAPCNYHFVVRRNLSEIQAEIKTAKKYCTKNSKYPEVDHRNDLIVNFTHEI